MLKSPGKRQENEIKGRYIKSLREAKEISQREMGRRIHQRYKRGTFGHDKISRLENGNADFSWRTIMILSAFFKVSQKELFELGKENWENHE